ncbi:hypothetical protein SAMN05880501_107112 [Ureibacillus xyleni]|uniref:Uncharacterized protein n=1 Tax=Ureibacillus xyleni TaxID=614648 RepID=A0A285SXB3_9BACL|nr:hypothetical protein SAMN05880501_107112 [Ureibacillus xyleni]
MTIDNIKVNYILNVPNCTIDIEEYSEINEDTEKVQYLNWAVESST